MDSFFFFKHKTAYEMRISDWSSDVCSSVLVRAAMSAQRNKTDATDALGLAHIMRTGWFRAAHIKTEACYRVRLLLVQRRNLKRKFLDLENTIRHSLKAFGVRLNKIGRRRFDQAEIGRAHV